MFIWMLNQSQITVHSTGQHNTTRCWDQSLWEGNYGRQDLELSTEPSITLWKPSAGSEIDIETFQPGQCVWLLSSSACRVLSFCCCCWSLLYSAIFRSQADSLRLHVILHEWIAFYSTFLNIHQSGILTALAWLVPHETAAISVRSVYTIQPCTISLRAKPHT